MSRRDPTTIGLVVVGTVLIVWGRQSLLHDVFPPHPPFQSVASAPTVQPVPSAAPVSSTTVEASRSRWVPGPAHPIRDIDRVGRFVGRALR